METTTNKTMAYYYSTKLRIPFDEAVTRVARSLKRQGFGIFTMIDVTDSLKQELNIDFQNYKILGVYNPQIAYKSITLESHIGLMLPCNILFQQLENGEVEVSAMNSLESVDSGLDATNLPMIAAEVSDRLRASLANVNRDTYEPKDEEALAFVVSNENVIARTYG